MSEERARVAWVDYARGIGIFLVVLGHVLRGLYSGKIVQEESAFHAVDSWIYAFHMPLFFSLSGLFAERRVGRSPAIFLREVFGSVVYPYLVWSMLQTLTQSALGGYTNSKASPSQLAEILVRPVMQFWFLYSLFLIYVTYYFIRRAGLGPLAAFAVFVASWSSRPWIGPARWWPLESARGHGVYFALGALATRYGWTGWIGRAPSAAMALTAALGYGAVSVAVARPLEDSFNAISRPAVALPGIAASIALAVLLSRARGLGFVRVMGAHSLEIYVAHTIASAGLRIALVKGLSIHDPGAHVAIGTVGGIVLPMLLSRLCQRHHADFLFRLLPRAARPEPSGPGPTRPTQG